MIALVPRGRLTRLDEYRLRYARSDRDNFAARAWVTCELMTRFGPAALNRHRLLLLAVLAKAEKEVDERSGQRPCLVPVAAIVETAA